MTATRLDCWLLALSIWMLLGCESSRFSQLQRRPTVEGCRRYLARYPDSSRRQRVQQLLEQAYFERVAKADRPLGYRQYLQIFPNGRRRARARQRLAELARGRARDLHEFQTLVERYPATPAGEEVEKRQLPAAWAQQVLASGQRNALEAFIARYPDHPKAPEVREQLAQASYPELADNLDHLERFIERFEGTAAGDAANKRIRRLLVREVRQRGTIAALESFVARFPNDSKVAELRRLVEERAKRRAVLALDAARLASWTDLARIGSWCRSTPNACQTLRVLAEAALSWGHRQSLQKLSEEIRSPAIDEVWRATAALSWLGQPGAGDLLFEALGSSRLAVVWFAQKSLQHWLGRRDAEARRRWIADRRATIRRDDSTQLQRQALWRYWQESTSRPRPSY